eukprot:TRINITY_DN3547_c0_g2_i1.p1 TRINITY_DN3547_c0_g2~~TRINITY_DN3547_c0_g2_i1.p1  ORF type:complete len:540 (-),score=120.21 TRINITY_DN3547_c0_g2_i1:173-1792(-)
MASASSTFFVPIINDNPEGWGPVGVPEDFENIPYAPFAKSDKLGKASDWSVQSNYQNRQFQSSRFQGQTVNSAFTYQHTDDEESFQVVDNKPNFKPKSYLRKNFNQNNKNRQTPQNRNQPNQQNPIAARQGQKNQKQNQKNRNWQRNNQWTPGRGYGDLRIKRESSVEIRPEWKVKEEIDLSSLSKITIEEVPVPEDLVSCGSLEYYDKQFERVTTQTGKLLERYERTFFKVTTTDDPVIRNLSMKNEANVFGIDAIICLLMACPRSIYSWDVVVQRVGSKLFFDKRENSQFDYLTVNETAVDPPTEDKDPVNSPGSLATEATIINQNFLHQVLLRDAPRYSFSQPNPFQSTGEPASIAYKYRRWRLSDDISVIIRSEIDGVSEVQGNDLFLTIKALHEFDPKISGVDWRQKLDTQRGSILATELKNNSNKLAKWLAQALLAGTDQLKLGFVSRSSLKDCFSHVILGCSTYKPHELALQMSLNVKNMWAILKYFIEMCINLPEGKYILVKDPNTPVVRLYEVPQNTFENEEKPTDSKTA